jgi:hypothetical protein
MMHYEKTVVTLVDSNKKPLREYNSEKTYDGRKCTVFLPFETEYMFLVKNNSDRRIKLDIDIDGTNVMGNGLIITSHNTAYIERFVDVAKRFKFVPINHEGVADPSSPENGIITVRVSEEIKPPQAVVIAPDPWTTPTSPYPYTYRRNTGWFGPYAQNVATPRRGFSPLRSCSSAPKSVTYSSTISEGSAGATVEGSVSDQSFQTTNWLGSEATVTTFKFYLKAPNQKDHEEYLKYLELKAKFE